MMNLMLLDRSESETRMALSHKLMFTNATTSSHNTM